MIMEHPLPKKKIYPYHHSHEIEISFNVCLRIGKDGEGGRVGDSVGGRGCWGKVGGGCPNHSEYK